MKKSANFLILIALSLGSLIVSAQDTITLTWPENFDSTKAIPPLKVSNCNPKYIKVEGDMAWLGESSQNLLLKWGNGDDAKSESFKKGYFHVKPLIDAFKEDKSDDIVPDEDIELNVAYVGASEEGAWIKAIRNGDVNIILQLKDCKGSEQEVAENTNTRKSILEQVQKKAKDELHKTFDFNKYTKNGIYIKEDVVYVFLDQDGNLIEGTKFPTSLKEESKYQYQIVIFADSNSYNKENFLLKIEGSEFRYGNSLTILNTIDGSGSAGGNSVVLSTIKSEIYGPFSDFVNLQMYRREDKEDAFENRLFDRSIALQNSKPYHVSVMGGFYFSTLNDPANIVQGINSNGDTTLFADNPNYQTALTVMAIFYPTPRNPNYNWRDLRFCQRFNFSFGLKISEDLLNDFLLGGNFEFAKGGNLSIGVHYGKHNTIRGYDNFKYGETMYNGTFTNDMITEEWDFGFFAGVTIDLRILGALRRSGESQRNSASDNNN